MKVVVCGSMFASKKMVEIKDILEKLGHDCVLPRHAEEYASGEFSMETRKESADNKIKEDLIRDYYKKIENCDALLAANVDKNGIENYIGGNTFLEMGFAHVLDKKLYVLNNIPEVSYRDEIIAMQPIVINGDLNKIQ